MGRAADGGVGAVPRGPPDAAVHASASPTPACSASWERSAYGAGLFSRTSPAAEYGKRFHGHNERVDVESLALTTDFYRRVVTEFMG